MPQFHKLSVASIEKITKNSVAITFHIPNELTENFKFKAGQYITLKTTINDQEIRRDYSICTSANSGNLTVGIKAIENGIFSIFANEKLTIGDILEVAEPQGRFVFEPHPQNTKTIAAFAAGSGITPILSIAKTLLEDEPFSNFILVYGNKSSNDTMFLEDLIELKNKYNNRIHVHHLYSQTKEDNALFGRIDKSIVNLITKNKYKGVTINSFFLCGPESIIHIVKDTLVQNGVKEKEIKFELFTSSLSKGKQTNETIVSGESSVKIIVDEEEFH